MIAPPAVTAALDALPEGSTTGRHAGRLYHATKSSFSGGRAVKLVAREAGGTGYISLNLYKLASGPRLHPCEMPAEKVIDFLLTFRPDATPPR